MNSIKVYRRKALAILKQAIIAVIIREKKIHGYGVYKELLHITRSRWRPSLGTIYRVLNEMVNEKLITRTMTRKGDRKIFYYSVTNEGLRYFIDRSKVIVERSAIALNMVTMALKTIRQYNICLLYTSPSPRDLSTSRMPSSA